MQIRVPQLERYTRRDRPAQESRHVIRRQTIAFSHTLAKAVRLGIAEHGSADVIGPANNEDVFTGSEPPRNHVVIRGEGGAVTFADIGQQAQQVMCSEPDGHAEGNTLPRWSALSVAAPSADFKTAPRMNGVTP